MKQRRSGHGIILTAMPLPGSIYDPRTQKLHTKKLPTDSISSFSRIHFRKIVFLYSIRDSFWARISESFTSGWWYCARRFIISSSALGIQMAF